MIESFFASFFVNCWKQKVVRTIQFFCLWWFFTTKSYRESSTLEWTQSASSIKNKKLFKSNINFTPYRNFHQTSVGVQRLQQIFSPINILDSSTEKPVNATKKRSKPAPNKNECLKNIDSACFKRFIKLSRSRLVAIVCIKREKKEDTKWFNSSALKAKRKSTFQTLFILIAISSLPHFRIFSLCFFFMTVDFTLIQRKLSFML